MSINQLINGNWCPECKYKRLLKRDIKPYTSVIGLSDKEREPIKKGKYRMFECDKCGRWFLCVNRHVYRYDGSPIGWNLIGEVLLKEVVIFT